MKRMVFIVTLALMPVGTFGQDLDAGLEAKEQGDYARALQELRLLADEGHAAGQYYLGEMYTSAKGVRWNPAEGLRWTMLAAENGYVRAQTVLGSLYLSSSFENHAEAVRWYSLAAKQGGCRRAIQSRQFVLRGLWCGSGLRSSPHVVQYCRHQRLCGC